MGIAFFSLPTIIIIAFEFVAHYSGILLLRKERQKKSILQKDFKRILAFIHWTMSENKMKRMSMQFSKPNSTNDIKLQSGKIYNRYPFFPFAKI